MSPLSPRPATGSKAAPAPGPGPFHVVLHRPEIPPNTGNAARTCAATGCTLHLIHPLGFRIDDRHLRRAGLDYWPMVPLMEHPDWSAFERWRSGRGRVWALTARAERLYTDADFAPGDFFLFGRETSGLPEELLGPPHLPLRVPMRPGIRSLNLGNTVALVLYEALRQVGFPGLS